MIDQNVNTYGLPQFIQGITWQIWIRSWWFIILEFCKDYLRDYMMINHNAPKPWQWWCCCWRWKWSFYQDTIYLQIGFNTKAGSPGYGFSTCSFPVSFRENNYVLISIFLTLWISLPRRMSLPSCGLGLEVSESFRCFCSFLNVTLRAAFQTAGGGGYT